MGCIVVTMGVSFLYVYLSLPREFRNGIYPKFVAIEARQEAINSRLDVIEKQLDKAIKINDSIMPSCFSGRKTN